MKERPILFNTDMVKAILEGRKTQTRRPIKPQPLKGFEVAGVRIQGTESYELFRNKNIYEERRSIYGKFLDELWVRETWRIISYDGENGDWLINYKDGTEKWFESVNEIDEDTAIEYMIRRDEELVQMGATWNEDTQEWDGYDKNCFRWRPSIHMPRWASRIQLKVLHIRVERIQDITTDEIAKEGVPYDETLYEHDLMERTRMTSAFCHLWNSIYARRGYPWANNDWVWVVEFEAMK